MPAELLLAFWCDQYHTLPDPGGMLEQDYRTIVLMNALLNIYRAVHHFVFARGEEIHNLTPDERKTLRRLMDMGIKIKNG